MGSRHALLVAVAWVGLFAVATAQASDFFATDSIHLHPVATTPAATSSFFYSATKHPATTSFDTLNSCPVGYDEGYFSLFGALTCPQTADDEMANMPAEIGRCQFDTVTPVLLPPVMSTVSMNTMDFTGMSMNTMDMSIYNFVGSCHLTTDSICNNPLGLDNLLVLVQGQVMFMQGIVAGDPKELAPPVSENCNLGNSGHNRQDNSQKREHQSSKAHAMGYSYHAPADHEPLPANVSVGPIIVYSGYATVIDRHTKKHVGKGWVELVWPVLSINCTPSPCVWEYGSLWLLNVPSASLPKNTYVARDPFKYKFKFFKGSYGEDKYEEEEYKPNY